MYQESSANKLIFRYLLLDIVFHLAKTNTHSDLLNPKSRKKTWYTKKYFFQEIFALRLLLRKKFHLAPMMSQIIIFWCACTVRQYKKVFKCIIFQSKI